MHFLPAEDDITVERKSSVFQHSNKLAVWKNNQWVPISFDDVDYISNSSGVVSHRAILADEDDIGYNFPVRTERFTLDTYLYMDHNEIVTKVLPKWFGEGFYEEYVKSKAFVNSDANALGTRNNYTLKVGLDYALADNTLEADDFDDE